KKPPKRAPPILHGHLDPGSSIRNLQTHTDTITALDFDAPFGTMVTAALDDTVRVWDLNLGSCMGHLEGHCASVRCLQVEDNIVATGSMDATVRLWDLSRVEYVPGREERKEGYVSSQGEADEEQAVVSTSGEQEGTEEPPTPSLPPAPSGSTHNCPLFTLEAHVDEVTALHFRGDTLISGSADKTLRQWDLQSGRCVQTLDVLWAAAQASTITSSSASTLSSSPAFGHYGYHAANAASSADANADFVGAVQVFESALAAGTADGMVRLWDLRSGQVSRSLVGHTGAVTCLQFDDTHLVTGSLDRSVR
ncbi:Mitochondrial fission protein, partial [Ascosphaera atra]